MPALAGVLTAMATPFDPGGGVDEGGARSLARHLIENGSHGVVVAGTTGESPTLTDDEIVSLLKAVRDELGPDHTIICGAGSNNTSHSQHLAAAEAEVGADAVLVVTPYYNKPNPAGIQAHFEAVAASAGVPVVIYNIPSRVVVNIPPADLAALGEIENVVAVKQANNDEVAATGTIEGLTLLAGNDDVFLESLEAGGAGGILVASHLVGPAMREIFDAFSAGDTDHARELNDKLKPVYDVMSVTTNPIPLKAALDMLGLCSDRMRLPMVSADADQRAAVRTVLEAHGLLAASNA